MSRRTEPVLRPGSTGYLRSVLGSKLRVWTKMISLGLAFSFILPYLALAAPSTTSESPSADISALPALTVNGSTLEVPAELGRIVSAYQGKSDRTVVFIHDLHCNYEVQKNIARLLENMAKRNGLELIGIEGASRTINTADYASFPIAEVKNATAEYFLKRGRINGAEQLAITGPYALKLEGIETEELYAQEKTALLRFLGDESQGYCEEIKSVLERLKAPLYTTDLSKLDHFRQQYDFEANNLETYCNQLLAEARRLGVEISPYTVLAAYAAEHRLPVTASADYGRLQADVEALDLALRDKLYTSPDQRQLDHYLRLLRISENMLNISATAANLEYFRTHRREFAIAEVVKFLDTFCYRNAIDLELSSGVTKLDEFLQQAARFYDVADRRSEAFAANLLRLMERDHRTVAAMVIGGYHAPEVEAALHRQGVSCLAVKPRQTKLYDDGPYFSLLRGEQSPIEKALAQNANLLAPEDKLNDLVFKKYWGFMLGLNLPGYFRSQPGTSWEQALQQAGEVRRKIMDSSIQIPFEYTYGLQNANQPFTNAADTAAFIEVSDRFAAVIRKAEFSSTEKTPGYVMAQDDLDNGYEFQLIDYQAKVNGKLVATPQEIRAKVLGDGVKTMSREKYAELARDAVGIGKPSWTRRLLSAGSGVRAGLISLQAQARTLYTSLAGRRIASLAAWVADLRLQTGARPTMMIAAALGAGALATAVLPGVAVAGVSLAGGHLALPGLLAGIAALPVVKRFAAQNPETGMGRAVLNPEDWNRVERAVQQARSVGYGSEWAAGPSFYEAVVGAIDREKALKAEAAQAEEALAKAQAAYEQAQQEVKRNIKQSAVQSGAGKWNLKDLPQLLVAVDEAKQEAQAAQSRSGNFQRLSRSTKGLAMLAVAWHQGETFSAYGLEERNGEANMAALVAEFENVEKLAEAILNNKNPKPAGDSLLAQLMEAGNKGSLVIGKSGAADAINALALMWAEPSAAEWSRMNSEERKAMNVLDKQLAAMRQLCRQKGIRVQVENPFANPVFGFHENWLEAAPEAAVYQKLLTAVAALDASGVSIAPLLASLPGELQEKLYRDSKEAKLNLDFGVTLLSTEAGEETTEALLETFEEPQSAPSLATRLRQRLAPVKSDVSKPSWKRIRRTMDTAA